MKAHEFIVERSIEKTYILYLNGKPASKYDSYAEAEYEGRLLIKNNPQWRYEVKTETCTLENFSDGKKPGRKGLAKRMGVPTNASVSSLRKIAKNSSGEKARMAHFVANMKSGRNK
jgi:hypothetical protein